MVISLSSLQRSRFKFIIMGCVGQSQQTLPVYYGTQMGSTKQYAKLLSAEIRKIGFQSFKKDLSEFSASQFKQGRRAIFLLASTGDGQPTGNAVEFYQWLKKGPNLKGFKYILFGFGNSSFKTFNGMARSTNRLLKLAEASQDFPYGEADDSKDKKADFNNWKQQLLNCLKKQLTNSKKVISRPPPFKLIVSQRQALCLQKLKSKQLQDMSIDQSVRQLLLSHLKPVLSKRELRQSTAEGSTLLIQIDCKGIKYSPAGNILIYPHNSSDQIIPIIKRFSLSQKQVVQPAIPSNSNFPYPITVRDLLMHIIDFRAKMTPTAEARLAELNIPLKKTLFQSIQDKQDFTFDEFINLSSPFKPRFFTICGVKEDVIQIMAKIEQQGVWGKMVLSRKVPFDIRINVRPSSFLGYEKFNKIIMVCAGTGLAPFKAIIQLNQQMKQRRELNLYFGCRKQSVDYLMKDELKKHKQKGNLKSLQLALSREGPKCYVQDLVKRDLLKLQEILKDERGVLMICGSGSMGKSVREVLVEGMEKRVAMSQKVIEQLWG